MTIGDTAIKLQTFFLAAVIYVSCQQSGGKTPNQIAAEINSTTDKTNVETMDTLAGNNKMKDMINGKAGLLHVDDGGYGNIPALFVHSFAGSSVQWAEQLEHLRGHRRAVAMDLRGHGRSDRSANNDYSVHAIAEDISAVADSLRLDQFILVGHSLGAAAAIEYASVHPQKVAGLMLVCAPGKTPEKQSKLVITSLESERYEQVMDDYMKQLLTNARPEVSAQVMESAKKIDRNTSLSIIKSVFDYDPLPALRKYPGKKLIVLTDREDKQPTSLAKSFPGIPHVVMAGVSHWVQMDSPDEFNKTMDTFISSASR